MNDDIGARLTNTVKHFAPKPEFVFYPAGFTAATRFMSSTIGWPATKTDFRSDRTGRCRLVKWS
ncbi:hypothetical protein [Methylohalobius crimeensis]|uniref:hypothetical protein n=1 Tax=Methylohalobius crimeensis TaxID=244365 RepID=UPI0003B53FA9|nr:hypothetical protein [Methylohalobius crimeensis]